MHRFSPANENIKYQNLSMGHFLASLLISDSTLKPLSMEKLPENRRRADRCQAKFIFSEKGFRTGRRCPDDKNYFPDEENYFANVEDYYSNDKNYFANVENYFADCKFYFADCKFYFADCKFYSADCKNYFAFCKFYFADCKFYFADCKAQRCNELG